MVENQQGTPSAPVLQSILPWEPHPTAAPSREKMEDFLEIGANGTRTCSGGWQLELSDIQPGQTYRISVRVQHEGLEVPRDALRCGAHWKRFPADSSYAPRPSQWEYLLPETMDEHAIHFSHQLRAPDDAECLTIRYTFRWSARGKTRWALPVVEAVEPDPSSEGQVEVGIVSGRMANRNGRKFQSVQDNMDFYAPLCEAACQSRPDLGLIVLPEIALQWQIPGSCLDWAIPAPGPETDVFAEIARQYRTRICLGIVEQEGDAVRNSALLINPEGEIDGRYYKVHLAVASESESGILPGDSFPVFDTEVGRLGCNICMDSSATESTRMVGLNGADFLLMPIMGDHRASRWDLGPSNWDEMRWKAILRTHAMDNQFCMVVARNTGEGSCIVDRSGKILAWNDGTQDFIYTAVPRDDGYRTWNGTCFKNINWMQRRPHLYSEFINPENLGSL